MTDLFRPVLYDKVGSLESYDWVKDINYKLNLPIGFRQIYDFWIYIKIINNAPEDVLINLWETRKKKGLSKAVQEAINICKMKRYNAKRKQDDYYDNIIMEAETDKIMEFYDKVTGRLEEQIKEAERCRNLTDEQRSMREKVYPTNNIPLSEFQTQPIIVQETRNNVTYRIYEKKYQNYAAVVFSPSRIKSNGAQGVIYIVEKDILELKRLVERTVEEEIGLQLEFENKQNQQKTTRTQNVNIDHVKKAMGLDKNRFGSDLDGNIF